MLGAKPETLVVVPVPEIAPGLSVQVPEAGKPLKATLPVAVVQVGGVIVPTIGASGVAATQAGCKFNPIKMASWSEERKASVLYKLVTCPAVLNSVL